MRHHIPAENTVRVVTLALAIVIALAAGAWVEGVFAKFESTELAALAAFAAAFALLTYISDRQVRELVDGVIANVRQRLSRPARRGEGNRAARVM